MTAIAGCGLFLSGCGNTFRPVANIIPAPAGNPTLNDMVAVLNQNPLAATPASFTLINVDGDTNVGNTAVGLITPATAAPPLGTKLITFAGGNAQVATANLGDGSGAASTSFTVLTVITPPPSTLTLPTGASPTAVAATVNSGLILVSMVNDTVDCPSGGAVGIIQASNPNLTSPRVCLPATAAQPGFILVMPDDNTALVLDSTNNSATIINLPSASVSATLTAGIGTTPVWAVANGQTAYVLNKGSNNISVVNVPGGSATVANAAGISSPSMIVADNANGRLYVSNTTNPGTVSVLDTLQPCPGAACLQSLHTPITVGALPVAMGIAVTSTATMVYVANTGGYTVSVINGNNFSTSSISVDPLTTVTWVAVSKDNTRAYISMVGSTAAGGDDSFNGTAILRTASNTLLTDSNGNLVKITPPAQDPTSQCYLNPSGTNASTGLNNCAGVALQRPIQVVPRN